MKIVQVHNIIKDLAFDEKKATLFYAELLSNIIPLAEARYLENVLPEVGFSFNVKYLAKKLQLDELKIFYIHNDMNKKPIGYVLVDVAESYSNELKFACVNEMYVLPNTFSIEEVKDYLENMIKNTLIGIDYIMWGIYGR